jgi:hypothetical protein
VIVVSNVHESQESRPKFRRSMDVGYFLVKTPSLLLRFLPGRFRARSAFRLHYRLPVRVNGRLALPGVETNAKLTDAVTLRVAAKLLMLPKLTREAAVVNGPFLKIVRLSGTDTIEKSGTPTVTAMATE